MSEVIEKPWGWSQEEVSNLFCQVHRIDIIVGGFCSWHKHLRKDNVFSVAKGRLVVEYHGGLGDILQVVLQPGDTYTIGAGVVHRFRAPFESVRAFEVYYPSEGYDRMATATDIERYSHGGRDTNAGGSIN